MSGIGSIVKEINDAGGLFPDHNGHAQEALPEQTMKARMLNLIDEQMTWQLDEADEQNDTLSPMQIMDKLETILKLSKFRERINNIDI